MRPTISPVDGAGIGPLVALEAALERFPGRDGPG